MKIHSQLFLRYSVSKQKNKVQNTTSTNTAEIYYYYYYYYYFRLTAFFQVYLGPPLPPIPDKNLWGLVERRIFTGWVSFLSPNHQVLEGTHSGIVSSSTTGLLKEGVLFITPGLPETPTPVL